VRCKIIVYKLNVRNKKKINRICLVLEKKDKMKEKFIY